MTSNYLTALCCDSLGKWKKYRNIREDRLLNFEKFAKLNGIRYINYYNKISKNFVMRKYL
jgi:hypothetical protein